MDDDPVYETLSYAWGDPTVTGPILLDGFEFQVTVNLKTALWHHRKADQPRTMLIYAICINQQDEAEKAEEVGLMGEIYRRCGLVYIWLGYPDETDFEIMKDMSESDENALPETSGEHPVEPGRIVSSWYRA